MMRNNRKYQALGRLKAGQMNNTEKLYAAHLEVLKHAGEILWYKFDCINLRLGDKCFYKVDFLVLTKDNVLEAHEVKGQWQDDALVKIKVAAETFPFAFKAYQFIKKQWVLREF